MNSIAQEARFRQRVVKYFYKHGATKASIRFKVCRQSVYNWAARYDGTWKSLVERSHRPHHHPEIKKRTARKPKPYERAMYPGQKVQVDVKYVPSECISNGKKYYQYTAVDECTRFCFREMYEEHSTYSSEDFIKKLLKAFPFPIREIQTDNGTEFTTALLTKDKQHRTLFEAILENHDIIYHRIRVATPRHNGKVERQHREDGKRFYSKMRMYSLEGGRKQIAAYNKRSNNIPKVCLKFRSPNEVLEDYLSVMW